MEQAAWMCGIHHHFAMVVIEDDVFAEPITMESVEACKGS